MQVFFNGKLIDVGPIFEFEIPMIKIPEHIQLLVSDGFLREKNDYAGRMFDKEEIRIFELLGSDKLCTLSVVHDEVTVKWTEEDLEIIPFLNAFECMNEEAKETVIFNMDKFHEEI